MEKKKYSVTMEPKLFGKIEALKESEHKSMNTIFLECIEAGLERLYGDQQIITKPQSHTDGTMSLEIPADIVEAARHAVKIKKDSAVEGQLYNWLTEGQTVNTSYKRVLGRDPSIPQLDDMSTKPKEVAKPSRWPSIFKR